MNKLFRAVALATALNGPFACATTKPPENKSIFGENRIDCGSSPLRAISETCRNGIDGIIYFECYYLENGKIELRGSGHSLVCEGDQETIFRGIEKIRAICKEKAGDFSVIFAPYKD